MRPDLGIQDITALLVSLLNLGLSCYPDRLEYVDCLLKFAETKIQEFSTQSVIRSMISLPALTPFHL
jgi:vacuolar protein sorting-associated protein 35